MGGGANPYTLQLRKLYQSRPRSTTVSISQGRTETPAKDDMTKSC